VAFVYWLLLLCTSFPTFQVNYSYLLSKSLMSADTILKKYSSTIATIFTGVASAVLFGHTLTINFVLGISIVIISMHQYLSNQIKDEVPSSKVEMAQVHDHRVTESICINVTDSVASEAKHRHGSDERQPLLAV